MYRKSLILLLFVNFIVANKGTRDSYIEAYTKSHSESGPVQVLKDRDFNEAYPAPQNTYGPPQQSYGPPQQTYGPPQQNNPPPQPSYGPPQPNYGPPSYNYQAPIYGAPTQVFYGMPHGMLNIFDKLKLKLDLFTIGKIILKLVIFKKIVSLIAILCLLLFIPSLKHKDDSGEDEEMRQFKSPKDTADEKLNNVTQYVLGAIESFPNGTQQNTSKCEGIYCDTQNYLKKINQKMSYKKLAKLYSKDLQ